jgi:SAM-dependent methyltransferase
MSTIYTSGKYLEVTRTWHAEDSHWKAAQIWRILTKNRVQPQRIVEVGCGVGGVLRELSRINSLSDAQFTGYDISPQAIELASQAEDKNIRFYCEDLLSESNTAHFDVLIAIDVYEHVPDYMGFLVKCKQKAAYKIYHIPLDLHVSSVLRNTFMGSRYAVGHLHYFTADSALATLKDTGHEIVDWFYTNPAIELFKEHPSIRKAVANVPRYLCSKLSLPFTARMFGGYSLLVLAN